MITETGICDPNQITNLGGEKEAENLGKDPAGMGVGAAE
jgi:hypothetical protein